MTGSDGIFEQRSPVYGGFSEDELIEQPTIDLFKNLGWQTANLFGEFGSSRAAHQSSEGRESRRDAVLPRRVKSTLRRLNPQLPDAALDEAYASLIAERAALEPVRANAELYDLLRNGIKVKVRSAGGMLRDE